MKTAILQCADQGPVESFVAMLSSIGYQCLLPNDHLRGTLRSVGCDSVYDVAGLVRSMGYERPAPLPAAGVREMDTCDLYVDVKAHRNGPLVWKRWPRLQKRTLWYRINGCAPEHVIKSDGTDCGDEVNPPCPVLTPNMCYRAVGPWKDKAYVCWPPFVRFHDYLSRHPRPVKLYEPPVCLVHNAQGWGYGAFFDAARAMGVRILGAGSPDGLVQHGEIPAMLSRALCMVHLKSSDAPGYAIYEAMAAGCPLVVTRRLIWRCRMQELLIPGETCLVFDRETHDGLSAGDVRVMTEELRGHLQWLSDPHHNELIGRRGHEKLKQVMWNAAEDRGSLLDFMRRHFS